MKKATAAILFASLALLSACGETSYADGVYTARSEVYEGLLDESGDEGGDGYGVVTLTIRDGAIADCEFTTYMTDGTVKDADYGKRGGEIANQDYYNKAQRAVQASANYAEQLKAKGDPKAVDAISGATISYNEFQDAVAAALDQAAK